MSRLNQSAVEPGALYADVMLRIRQRFDAINALRKQEPSWSVGESIGTHLRKIIEGVAFGCIVAMQNSTKKLLRRVVGKWNADDIFFELKKLDNFCYPDPSDIRPASEVEKRNCNVEVVLEGQEDRRISVDDLRAMYQRTHPWTHEDNPYVTRPLDDKNFDILIEDVDKVERMLSLHRIGIMGESFICIIRDKNDGQLKVHPISKIKSL